MIEGQFLSGRLFSRLVKAALDLRVEILGVVMFDRGRYFKVLISIVFASSVLAGIAACASRQRMAGKVGVVDLERLRNGHPRGQQLKALADSIERRNRYLTSSHCVFGRHRPEYFLEIDHYIEVERQKLAEEEARFTVESREVAGKIVDLVGAEAARLGVKVVIAKPQFAEQTFDLTPSCLLLMQQHRT